MIGYHWHISIKLFLTLLILTKVSFVVHSDVFKCYTPWTPNSALHYASKAVFIIQQQHRKPRFLSTATLVIDFQYFSRYHDQLQQHPDIYCVKAINNCKSNAVLIAATCIRPSFTVLKYLTKANMFCWVALAILKFLCGLRAIWMALMSLISIVDNM